MKRNILSAVLTLYCLLPIAAQPLSKADSLQIEIAQLENALTSIQTDLQEKTLQYNWENTLNIARNSTKSPTSTANPG
jgi:cell division protein ZapA (FtsZ GTPase activity inhibitor)